MPKNLTVGQVAEIFDVHPNTVVDWANGGRLAYKRTPGGHRRFDPADVEKLRAETESKSSPATDAA